MVVSLAQIRETSGEVFTEGCPTRVVLDHIMSKWGVLVLLALTDGTLRWGELRREVEGISEKMLASTLRTLEADGLVDAHVVSRGAAAGRVRADRARARTDGADAAAGRVGGAERGGDPQRRLICWASEFAQPARGSGGPEW